MIIEINMNIKLIMNIELVNCDRTKKKKEKTYTSANRMIPRMSGEEEAL